MVLPLSRFFSSPRRPSEVPSPDRTGDFAQGPGAGPRAPADRRHAIQGRLWHHGRGHGPHRLRRQQAVHGPGRRGDHPRSRGRARTIACGRPHDGDGVGRRPAWGSSRTTRRGPARGAADRPGFTRIAESSTLPSFRAITRPPPAGWPNRWEWTVTSLRFCRPTRPIM